MENKLRNFSDSLLSHPEMAELSCEGMYAYSRGFPSERLGTRAISMLRSELFSIVNLEVMNNPELDTAWAEKQKAAIAAVLTTYWPNIDPLTPNMLWIYPDHAARTKGKMARRATKIGRTLVRMFPCLRPSEVEDITDAVKARFFTAEWRVLNAKDRAAFKHAYSSAYGETRNLDTTFARKRISDSCMRYAFDHLPAHPAEAFASGDFEIFWTENQEGKIGSRCVVSCGEKRYAGPIYACCERSHDTLYDHIKPKIYGYIAEGCWDGLKLLALPYAENGRKAYNENGRRESFIAPYLDLDPRNLERHSNEYLIVAECGEISGSGYSGLQYYEHTRYCSSCGDGVDEDDSLVDDDGNTWCDSCYWENHFTCDYDSENYHRDHRVFVMTEYGEQIWAEWNADNHAIMTLNGELWYEDDCIELANGDFVSKEVADDEYFECILDGKWYPIAEMTCTADGDRVLPANVLAENKCARLLDHPVYIWNDDLSHWVLTPIEGGLEREA